MGRYQSGQMGRTVNPLSTTSGVRIPPGPPYWFCISPIIQKIQEAFVPSATADERLA